jgi:hypothetical protein
LVTNLEAAPTCGRPSRADELKHGRWWLRYVEADRVRRVALSFLQSPVRPDWNFSHQPHAGRAIQGDSAGTIGALGCCVVIRRYQDFDAWKLAEGSGEIFGRSIRSSGLN